MLRPTYLQRQGIDDAYDVVRAVCVVDVDVRLQRLNITNTLADLYCSGATSMGTEPATAEMQLDCMNSAEVT